MRNRSWLALPVPGAILGAYSEVAPGGGVLVGAAVLAAVAGAALSAAGLAPGRDRATDRLTRAASVTAAAAFAAIAAANLAGAASGRDLVVTGTAAALVALVAFAGVAALHGANRRASCACLVLAWASAGAAWAAFSGHSVASASGLVTAALGAAGIAAWLGPLVAAALVPSPNAARLLSWARWWPYAAGATVLALVHVLVAAVAAEETGSRQTMLVVTIAVAASSIVAPATTALAARIRSGGRPAASASGLGALAAVVVLAMVAAVPLAAPAAPASSAPPRPVEAPAAQDGPAAGPVGVADQEAFAACAPLSFTSQLDCYTEFFDEVRTRDGVGPALDALLAAHEAPAGEPFRQHCHEVLHELAVRAVNAAEEPAGVFAHLTTACTGGFAHGTMLSYIQLLEPAELKERYAGLCAELVETVSAQTRPGGDEAAGDDAADTAWVRWNCDHILGHALYFMSAAEDDVAAGAERCLAFPESDSAFRDCLAGYFMEYYLDVLRTEDHPDFPTEVDEVLAMCEAVDPGVAVGCYSEAGAAVVAFHQADWAAAYDTCATRAPAEHVDVCFESIGRLVTVYNAYDEDAMREVCAALPDGTKQDRCATAISSAMVMELQDIEGARRVCQEVVGDPQLREECLGRAESIDAQLSDSGFTGLGFQGEEPR